MKLSAVIRKQDSINTIKFIGRLHSSLTDIVDQLNRCYSYQVCFVSIKIFIRRICFLKSFMMTDGFVSLDDGEHGGFFCVLHSNILQFLSIHSPTERFLQRSISTPRQMAIFLFHCCAIRYLHSQSRSSGGKFCKSCI